MLQIIGPVTNVKNINVNNPKILMSTRVFIVKNINVDTCKILTSTSLKVGNNIKLIDRY